MYCESLWILKYQNHIYLLFHLGVKLALSPHKKNIEGVWEQIADVYNTGKISFLHLSKV